MAKRALARTDRKRKPLKRRVADLKRRVEDRALGVADRCMDVVEANLDTWLDQAAGALLRKVGLAPPERITMKDASGKVIELVKQPDGSYA